MRSVLRQWLAHPLTAGLDLDDPATTELRRQIIQSKPFLKAIYDEWYSLLAAQLADIDGPVLELGSGAGYLHRFVENVITSEVFFCSGVALVANAQELPIATCSLRAIAFTDVLHHIPNARDFFREAIRCLRPGGKIVMIEPWVSRWSHFVYTHFHHELFAVDAKEWTFPSHGPLSGANGALPWIVFQRDRRAFELEFPELKIEVIRPLMPFRYLLSGGVSMRTLMPPFTQPFWRLADGVFKDQGMFALISLVRK